MRDAELFKNLDEIVMKSNWCVYRKSAGHDKCRFRYITGRKAARRWNLKRYES